MTLTSPVSQDDLALTSDPAVAGELDVIPVGCLQCDVLQVPVIMEPVLALLNSDKLDLPQFFIHSHIVRINLYKRKELAHLSLRSEEIKNMPPQTFCFGILNILG